MFREVFCIFHPVSLNGTSFELQKQKTGSNLSKYLPEQEQISCHFSSFAQSGDQDFESWGWGWSPASGPCSRCLHAGHPVEGSRILRLLKQELLRVHELLSQPPVLLPADYRPDLPELLICYSPRLTFQFCWLKLLFDPYIQLTSSHSFSFCSSNCISSLSFPQFMSFPFFRSETQWAY